MENTVKTGLNRTGTQMSPIDSLQLEKIKEMISPDISSTMNTIEDARVALIREADKVGSVPIPTTFTGLANTAIEKIKSRNLEVFIDKLGERLAFERTGTRLYDALIAKYCSLEGYSEEMLQVLKQFRNQEANHFRLINDILYTIGADPSAQTPCADMIGVSSIGLIQTITDPRSTLTQSLNALLTAELTDNAGWEMLILMAREFAEPEIVNKFQIAYDQENSHLKIIKHWLQEELLKQTC